MILKEEAESTDLPGVAAASRALSIAAAFRSGDKSLSLAELSRRTGFYKSTILRLIESLEHYRFIQRLDDGDFILGQELIRLGSIAARATDTHELVTSSLRRLVAQTGESATFYVPRESFRLALLREDSPKTVRDHIRVGDLLPRDRGAAGHVLDHSVDGVIATYVSRGERDPDLAAIAGPVFEDRKLIGAIQVSGPISRFCLDKLDQARLLVEEECRFLERALARR